MMDSNAINAGRENFSSVTDLGNIFTKIYNHKCVNENFDNLMLEFLKAQTDTDCFPAALPDKIIATKPAHLTDFMMTAELFTVTIATLSLSS